ncbi:MAG TPA: GTP-dependent dephospho-CoA kinase family protein [Candidatus Thermoplasmatota archaeon]|nr:GTP-dependent dephospho-CoA kinase family protein [Candidatus Thermoplasmatota archaeon]
MRAALATPLGPVLSTRQAFEATRGLPVATVGDVTTATFVDAGYLPQVMVVDHLTKRVEIDLHLEEKLKNKNVVTSQARNPPGVITDALWDAIARAWASSRPTLVVVDGEEDLAALPVLALAPEGAAVVYGQPPDRGVVVVRADAQVKRLVESLLLRME